MPLNAEGLRLYPRRPYASMATSAFDYPLSSRFDESDNLVVLRDVFVPWEHVFVHRDIGLVSAQFYETGAHVLANYQALVRFLVKMEFAVGHGDRARRCPRPVRDPAGPGPARRGHRRVLRGAGGDGPRRPGAPGDAPRPRAPVTERGPRRRQPAAALGRRPDACAARARRRRVHRHAVGRQPTTPPRPPRTSSATTARRRCPRGTASACSS